MTNAEARFNKSLRPRKPEGSLGRRAQDGHLDFHTAPELCVEKELRKLLIFSSSVPVQGLWTTEITGDSTWAEYDKNIVRVEVDVLGCPS